MASPGITEVDKSLSVSKYEEYEMRPIKPLNTDLQLKMYGSTSAPNLQTTKLRPAPLKKNSGSTSKHAVTGLRKRCVGINAFFIKNSVYLYDRYHLLSDYVSQGGQTWALF